MANSSHRKKTFAPAIRFRLVHFALFLLVLCNLFVIWRFERSRKPQIVQETITIVTNQVYVVTNFLSGADAPGYLPGNALAASNEVRRVNDPQWEIELPYRYGVAFGQRYVDIGGRLFSEGSPTSYGVIVRIFPERLVLDNGYFIKNLDFNNRFRYDLLNQRVPDERLIRANATDPDPPVVVRHTYDVGGSYNKGYYYD